MRFNGCWLLDIILLLWLTIQVSQGAQHKDAAAQAFFDSPQLTRFHIELTPIAYQQLLRQPRQYVTGTVRIDDHVYENVGVRLKGSGTFQPVSMYPNLTLKLNWQVPHQEFSGLTKLFLENSGQDATRLCKFVASSIYADAQIPVPRVTHGQVQLNERDLGRYVVVEATDQRFLKRHFGNSQGALYEGGFRDINTPLQLENGVRSAASDPRQLYQAALVHDPGQRRQALSQVLDLEEFLNLLAVEMMIANWDGYAMNCNNYRLYHNPDANRLVFIPHDLDNTLFESGLSLMPPRKSILVKALLETAEARENFRQRIAQLIPKVFDLDKLRHRVQAGADRLKQGASPADIEGIEQRAALLQQRLAERLEHLRAELAGNRPETPVFNQDGVAQLSGWKPKLDWNLNPLEMVQENQRSLLAIHATNGYCFSSWRLPVWLPAGQYRLQGLVRASGVRGLPSRMGSGAGVRVVGTARNHRVEHALSWIPITHDFVVQPDCEWVELIVELRAFYGKAWFDPESLLLTRRPK